ncbi:GroES-like protein [Amylostereum chailletii]|nr:GroES-like protein [Amylostereum chailletii]
MSTPTAIPRTQRAAVVTKFSGPVQIQTDYPVIDPAELKPGYCLVRMSVSGVCHSDLHIKDGEWPGAVLPLVGGHEGVGTIVAMGAGTPDSDHVKLGSKVGIKWTADACGRCELCRSGNEPSCLKTKSSGFTMNGTFSEYVVAAVNHVVPIPDGLEDHIAAPTLCAGLTVYRGLKVSNTKVGEWVVLPGAGGGLGHMAVQYAVAMGLRVVAIDTGDDKRDMCLRRGAEKWIDFKKSTNVVEDVKAVTGGLGPHAAVITSPMSTAYEQAFQYLRPTGTLVAIGLPTGYSLSHPLAGIVSKSLRIVGSNVGNFQDAVEALDLVQRGKVQAHITLRKLEDLDDIFQEMSEGKLVGRAVVQF